LGETARNVRNGRFLETGGSSYHSDILTVKKHFGSLVFA